MRKAELISKATALLRESGARKRLPPSKHIFHISDEDGNINEMAIKLNGRTMLFSTKDVETVLNALFEVAYSALKRGEEVSIVGFGTLGIRHVKGRTLKGFDGNDNIVADRYIPKMTFGKHAMLCAKLYELSLEDRDSEEEPLIFSDEENESYPDAEEAEGGDSDGS